MSPTSVHTLELQGGPMAAEEVARFEAQPHADDATRLRRWDDAGKVAGMAIPSLAEYRRLPVGLLEDRGAEPRTPAT